MTLYKIKSVKTAIEIVLMMKVDDDLRAKNMGAFPPSYFLREDPLQEEAAIYISESMLLAKRKRGTSITCKPNGST